jgi:hypothetical protein
LPFSADNTFEKIRENPDFFLEVIGWQKMVICV